jgi:DMSO/TMAO reductase YedYZ molybdopterin-dependent catalytic subunit
MELLRLNIAEGERQPGPEELAFQVAVLAAICSTAVSFIARFVFGAPLIPELAAQFIFAVAPIWAVEIAVGMLGPFAKHLGFLGCTVLYLLMLGGAALAFLKLLRNRYAGPPRLQHVLLFCGLVLLVIGVIIVPALGGGFFGRLLPQGQLQSLGWLAVGYAAFGFALYYAGAFYLGAATVESPSRLLNRRRLVRAAGYAVVLVGIYDIGRQLLGSWLTSGSGRVHRGDGQFPNIDNLALEVTPTPDFYEVSKNAYDPIVEPAGWRLDVGGLVDDPLSLTLDDIKSFPTVEQYATLCCISNEVGGDLIGNAKWRGVRLKDVLARAGLKPGVIDLVLRAADDYTDSIPLDRALADGTLLVYEMNDQPLPPEHGFPLRLLVPGIYGMKNVKWIRRIEAIDFDFKGYWQRRGWDDRAEYKTMSRIDTPKSPVKGETTIAGIAFAGDRGVSKVEVSVDGGKTWETAEIKEPLGPYSWVLWHKRWTPGEAGSYRLVVRAADGLGDMQTSIQSPPAPNGSSGYHSITVKSDSTL